MTESKNDEWVTVEGVRYEPRHKVIEECAEVAKIFLEAYRAGGNEMQLYTMVAAIRGLKDKP